MAEFVTGDLLRETTATISGTGTLTARKEQFIAASIGGAGALIASLFPTANLSGAGTLAAWNEQFVEATIGGAGTLWSYAESSRPTTAYLSGAGSLVASPYPTATLTGAGSLTASTGATATLAGLGRMTAEAYRGQLTQASIVGAGKIIAFADVGGRGYGSLPVFVGLGGDTDYGQGRGDLPYFVSGATNGQSGYVPPPINRGYGLLPIIVGAARGVDIAIGTASASLPAFIGVAGDYSYGLGSGSLPLFVGAAYSGFVPDNTMVLVSPMLGTMPLDPQIDLVLILNSSGQLTSTLTLTREQALELISAMQAASTITMLGVYGFSLLSDMRGLSIQTLSVNNHPDLHDTGVVWVVNTTNNASSQYERYGFNSFFTRDGKAYGVAEDGIYLLEGNTDNGAEISALADFGRSNFGSPQLKSVTNVYLGVGSDAALYLKVDADGQEYVYAMRDSSTITKNHRVDLGRGLKGNYWNMTLLNTGGTDFNLASVVFEPIPLSRKI